MKSKDVNSKAEDNIGLAYDYVQQYVQYGIRDSEVFADACVGLVKAERDYDPNLINPHTGTPYAFSTLAYKYMRRSCMDGYRDRRRLENLQPLNPRLWKKNRVKIGMNFAVNHLQNKLRNEDKPVDHKCIVDIVEHVKNLKLSTCLQLDLEMLLLFYLKKMELKQIGARYNFSVSHVWERIRRIKKHLVKILNYEMLEEMFECKEEQL